LHPLGIVGMAREPCLDVAAALGRQFVVDIGVQFIFGNGYRMVGHCRYLYYRCLGIIVVSVRS
jgi:hypothetical protein